MDRPARILLVDDDTRFRILLKGMVESLGYEAEPRIVMSRRLGKDEA